MGKELKHAENSIYIEWSLSEEVLLLFGLEMLSYKKRLEKLDLLYVLLHLIL